MMKKLLPVIFFLLTVSALSGQSRWAFGLDLEGGISGTHHTDGNYLPIRPSGGYSYSEKLRYRPGKSMGVWAEWLASRRIGLRLGINYAHLSGHSSTENISYNASGNVTFYSRESYRQQQQQLRIPLEGKLYLGRASAKWRPFVSLGVQAGYLLQQRTFANDFYSGTGIVEPYDNVYVNEIDLNPEYVDISRWQLSPITGVGLSGDRITISLQRSWGLRKQSANYGFIDDCNCFGVLCDCFLPHYGGRNRAFSQLHLTSLRLAYRIF